MSPRRENRRPSERPGAQGGKRDRNRRRRTRELVDAATGLFLQKGVEAVTIDEIAREAGTAKGNFYRYFKDKQDLVATILEPTADEIRQALAECLTALRDAAPDDTAGAYVTLANRLARTAQAHPRAIQLYLQEKRAPAIGARAHIQALAQEFERAAVELSRFALDQGLVSVSDPQISAMAVLGAIEALTLGVLRGDLALGPAVVGETLVGIVLDGIRPRTQ